MSNILEYIHKDDTIAAISTAQGVGGIGIIRISGPESWDIAKAIFRDAKQGEIKPDKITENEMNLGYIFDSGTGTIVDQVMCVFFKGPRSYTGQDTVEIQGHGGPAVLGRTLELAQENGARQAGPGEFTYRAFQSGKIDLGQAEAVCRLIEAGNNTQAMMALANLKEGLSRSIEKIRNILVKANAAIDAAIDFPDEMEEILPKDFSREIRETACAELERMIEKQRGNKVFAQGAGVVICGKPNVGKSSLFNALLGRERALVYETAGTTRDSLEESINLGGVAVRLTDTAGIGEAGEEIEALGMGISREKIDAADMCLVVLDGSQPLKPEDLDILRETESKKRIIAVNKSDKSDSWIMPANVMDGNVKMALSAKHGLGLDELTKKMREILTEGQAEPAQGQATVNQRQALLLEKCLENCMEALIALESNENRIEIASLEINQALRFLGEVDGQYASDLVLEEIFSKFCVGK